MENLWNTFHCFPADFSNFERLAAVQQQPNQTETLLHILYAPHARVEFEALD